MNEAFAQEAPGMDSVGPGRHLAAAREARGLSIAEAAAALKLSPRQIEALEGDNYDKLPGAIFVRGFLRSYARLLNLDASKTLQTANLLLGSPGTDSRPPVLREVPFPETRKSVWRWVALAGALALLTLLVNEAFFSQPERERDRVSVAAVATPAPQLEPVASAPALLAVRESSPPEAALQPAAPTPRASAGARIIQFNFDKDSWIEIRDSKGKVILSGLNHADTVQSIALQTPASLIVGNAANVRMSVDGAPYDLKRYVKVDVARFKLE